MTGFIGGLAEDEKAAFEAMLEGFKEANQGAGYQGLDEVIKTKSDFIKEQHSAYLYANKIGYEWMSKNANSNNYKANVIEGAVNKIKADIAQSIVQAEDSVNTAEKTKKFLTNFSRASGALGVVMTVEEIATAVDSGDTQEVARLVTKAAVVSATSYTAATLAGMAASGLAGALTVGLTSSLLLAIIPIVVVGVAAYVVADAFDKATKKDGGKYAHYFSGFDSASAVMQSTFGGDAGAVDFTRDLMANHAGFSYDGVNELVKKGIHFDSIQSAALNFNSLDGKTLGDEKKDVIEGTDILLDKLYGMGGDDYLKGLKGFDFLDGGDGNDFLDGGEDSDILVGGAGVDRLEGGDGKDTYIFDGDFGRDIVVDSDGDGTIIINGVTLSNFEQVAGTDIIYRDDKNNPTFEAIKINEGTSISLLITPLGVAINTGTVVIKNWSEGGLGIHLDEPDEEDPDMTGIWTINGNGNDNAISATNYLVDHPTKSLADYKGLSVNAGAGHDAIMGLLHGNDTLLGGDGDDVISGGFSLSLGETAFMLPQLPSGTGIDSIDGGKGDDYISVSANGSVAHGGDDNDVLTAATGLYIEALTVEELKDEHPDLDLNEHAKITRDQVWSDVRSMLDFTVSSIVVGTSSVFTANNGKFIGLTPEFAEFTGVSSGATFIAKEDAGRYSLRAPPKIGF